MLNLGRISLRVLKNSYIFSHRARFLRCNHTQILIKDHYLKLTLPNTSLDVDFMWLRDHCRCPKCYNQATSQRSLPFLSISSDIKPHSCQLSKDESKLLVTCWFSCIIKCQISTTYNFDVPGPDGHKSEYDSSWLQRYLESKFRMRYLNKMNQMRVLWEEGKAPSLIKSNYFNLVEKDDKSTLNEIVSSLLKYGMAVIEKVPRTMQATQLAIEKIAPVQRTFFGGMWEFGIKPKGTEPKHEDTAYTSEALDPHNDSTYFTESTGLQVFHCIERSRDCKGGETILVDGMAAAQALAKEDPEAFELLSSIAIESEYKEQGQHHMGRMPVIVLDPVTRQVLQIRFNLYDRAPISTLDSADAMRNYYIALQKFSRMILGGKYEIKITLEKGVVIIIDNWRILHGRTAFTGQRHMTGCYVGRTDWLSSARVLGLI